jgi:hypothetical protein
MERFVVNDTQTQKDAKMNKETFLAILLTPFLFLGLFMFWVLVGIPMSIAVLLDSSYKEDVWKDYKVIEKK